MRTNDDAQAAWVEVVDHAHTWASGPRWVGGEIHHAPTLRPELAAGVAAVGGLRRIAYRTLNEEANLRAHFCRVYEAARVADQGGVA
jgi:hypothetical protein